METLQLGWNASQLHFVQLEHHGLPALRLIESRIVVADASGVRRKKASTPLRKFHWSVGGINENMGGSITGEDQALVFFNRAEEENDSVVRQSQSLASLDAGEKGILIDLVLRFGENPHHSVAPSGVGSTGVGGYGGFGLARELVVLVVANAISEEFRVEGKLRVGVEADNGGPSIVEQEAQKPVVVRELVRGWTGAKSKPLFDRHWEEGGVLGGLVPRRYEVWGDGAFRVEFLIGKLSCAAKRGVNLQFVGRRELGCKKCHGEERIHAGVDGLNGGGTGSVRLRARRGADGGVDCKMQRGAGLRQMFSWQIRHEVWAGQSERFGWKGGDVRGAPMPRGSRKTGVGKHPSSATQLGVAGSEWGSKDPESLKLWPGGERFDSIFEHARENLVEGLVCAKAWHIADKTESFFVASDGD